IGQRLRGRGAYGDGVKAVRLAQARGHFRRRGEEMPYGGSRAEYDGVGGRPFLGQPPAGVGGQGGTIDGNILDFDAALFEGGRIEARGEGTRMEPSLRENHAGGGRAAGNIRLGRVRGGIFFQKSLQGSLLGEKVDPAAEAFDEGRRFSAYQVKWFFDPGLGLVGKKFGLQDAEPVGTGEENPR